MNSISGLLGLIHRGTIQCIVRVYCLLYWLIDSLADDTIFSPSFYPNGNPCAEISMDLTESVCKSSTKLKLLLNFIHLDIKIFLIFHRENTLFLLSVMPIL